MKKGFTLVEVLIVISVMTLLTAFSVPAFVSFQKSQTLSTASGKLKEDLRLLQSKATAAVAAANQSRAWGVHLIDGANSYRFFSCAPDAAYYNEYVLGSFRCSDPVSVNFDTTSIVTRISGATEADIVFDVLTGTVIYNGGVSGSDIFVDVAYADGSESRSVLIGPGGSIGD